MLYSCSWAVQPQRTPMADLLHIIRQSLKQSLGSRKSYQPDSACRLSAVPSARPVWQLDLHYYMTWSTLYQIAVSTNLHCLMGSTIMVVPFRFEALSLDVSRFTKAIGQQLLKELDTAPSTLPAYSHMRSDGSKLLAPQY